MFAHRIQLPRKPEPKEVDITYGKKVKEVSCREKTSKEEWKEREASSNPTVPTRIKIFEGGSVSRKKPLFVLRLEEIYPHSSNFTGLTGTSPMKIMSTSEVEGGGSTSVRNVVFAAKSPAC